MSLMTLESSTTTNLFIFLPRKFSSTTLQTASTSSRSGISGVQVPLTVFVTIRMINFLCHFNTHVMDENQPSSSIPFLYALLEILHKHQTKSFLGGGVFQDFQAVAYDIESFWKKRRVLCDTRRRIEGIMQVRVVEHHGKYLGMPSFNIKNDIVHGGHKPRVTDVVKWCARYMMEFQDSIPGVLDWFNLLDIVS
ncbi:hypothetical protein F8388_012987 [Cannabis sativa]|uniref:Uncharacterized protein n=1 Tax=Cannabis sativa TaxID=3483 RepID=A0A7J6EA63_CANSA|nr:hypothetical protein F8388_012987 [Cannabis sativa]